ncbi:unnamed protein product [Soboliphyme baturini]|uniref:Mitochondrial carrier protein n=1 Tax=Soboliphyme baturini TaxID=241478 RepID=A0A183IBK0_9BILA|nr:unnamed protein product [Soboliphyme baturini]
MDANRLEGGNASGDCKLWQYAVAISVLPLFSRYEKQHEHQAGRVLETKCVQRHQDFVCGWGAALIETILTYPFSKLVVRQQLQGIPFHVAVHQLYGEGLRNVYRGLLPPLVQRTSSRCLMFGMYDEYCKLFHCHDGTWMPLPCSGGAAFLAGTTEALLCPFERMQTLLQSPRYQSQFRNALDVNVLFFALRDPLAVFFTSLVLPADSSPSAAVTPISRVAGHFVTGALLGAILSTLFYPVNVVKIRMQASIGGTFPRPLTVLKQLLVERSFSVSMLYRGVHLNYTRSMMTWGITNAAYEFLKRSLFPGPCTD